MPEYCVSCGHDLPKGTKFCPGCGTKVEELPPAQAQPETPQQVPVPPLPSPPIQAPKKPKTKILALIGIIIVAVIVIVVLFLFVFQNNAVTADTSDFIGSWGAEFIIDVSNPDITFSFYSNGSLYIQSGTLGEWNTYEITNGKLCLASYYYRYYHCYDYVLSPAGSSLTLKVGDLTTHIFYKIA